MKDEINELKELLWFKRIRKVFTEKELKIEKDEEKRNELESELKELSKDIVEIRKSIARTMMEEKENETNIRK